MFLVSKNACPLRGISDGPDGPKFDVRARGFPPRAPSASPAGRVLPLPVLASLRSGWSSPQPLGWVGLCQRQGCASPVLAILAMLALRAVRGSGLLGRPLTLPHPSKRAYGPLRASWIRSSGLPGPQGTE